jgi:hypothetical protein
MPKSNPSSPSAGRDAATPCDSTTTTCPLKDELKLVELVETTVHKGTKKNQAAGGRKQYINLDATVDADNPHPEHGRVLRFKARVEWASGDKSKALSGQTVYWGLTPNGANKAGLTAGARAGLGAADGTLKSSNSCDAAGWTAEMSLHLSQYGGDKFKINATLASDHSGGLASGEYVVWRKLWYEVDTMKKRSGSGVLTMDHAQLPGAYTPCFIELEKQGTDNEPANKWNLQTGELAAFAADYFGAERSPFQSHEVGIDHQADKADGLLEVDITAAKFLHGTADSYYVYDGAGTWLKTAQYDDGSGWKNLDKAKVSLIGASPVYKKIEVDMSAGPAAPTAAKPVKVKLTFTRSKEWSGDGANSPHAVVAMGYWYDTESETEAKKRTVGTMAHELGHLLGMVPAAQSTHIDTGTGQHCNDAACVMFSTNTPTRLNSFCAVCTETLRGADLTAFKAAFTKSKGAKA